MTSLAAPILLTLLTVGQGQFEPRGVDPRVDPLDNRLQPRNEGMLGQPAAGPVVGGMNHVGWGLHGSKGRHYFFGGTAFGDYSLDGRQRFVVSMVQEEAVANPDPDKYLYYRELSTGNRWAVATKVGRNGGFAIYYQDARHRLDANGQPQWTLLHTAQVIKDTRAAREAAGIPEGGMADNTRDVDPRAFVRPTLRQGPATNEYYSQTNRDWVFVPNRGGDDCCGQ